MRTLTKAVALAAILAFPVATFAAQGTTPAKQTATKSAKKAPATKTAMGTVKSISDSQLVITKGAGKKATDETFTVNASTTKTGTVEAGAKVSVRYTSENGANTATAITASAAKKSSCSKKK